MLWWRSDLVEGLNHGILVRRVDCTWAVAFAQSEDGFHDRELRSCCIEA